MNTQQLQERRARLAQAQQVIEANHQRLANAVASAKLAKELEEDLLIPLARINPYYFVPVSGARMQLHATRKHDKVGAGYLVCRWRKLMSGLSVDELNQELIEDSMSNVVGA